MRRQSFSFVIRIMLFLLVMVCSAAAAENDTGITVVGEGKATAKPSVVEIQTSVSAKAEASGDALTKFQERKRKAIEALEKLNNAALSIEAKGFEVGNAVDASQQIVMMQGGAPRGPQEVEISETVTLRLKDVDKLQADELLKTVTAIIDTARDAGMQVGPPGAKNFIEVQVQMQTGGRGQIVTFIVSDPDALREQAHEKAMEDAKVKAERLAKLAGVKISRIAAVAEASQLGSGNDSMQMFAAAFSEAFTSARDLDIRSHAFAEIPYTATLTVRFEIAE